MTVTNATHTVRPANLAVAHVRGVQPMPVSLTGSPAEDRETVEQAIRQALRLVVPLAVDRATLRWRPDNATVDVRLPGLGRSHPRPQHVATFRVRPVDQTASPQDTALDPDPVDAARRAARDTDAAALTAIREVLGDQPVRMAGAVEQAVRRALLAAHTLGREEGWRACAVEHHLPTD